MSGVPTSQLDAESIPMGFGALGPLAFGNPMTEKWTLTACLTFQK